MERGEIWMVSLPFTRGREQSGERPALVLQDAAYGQGSPLVLVALLTSRLAALRFPATLQVEPTDENGLTTTSVVMVFQARALDRSRFRRRLGVLDEAEVTTALAELRKLTGE